MREINLRYQLYVFALALCLPTWSRIYGATTSDSYRKAAEGEDVVKNKLFPKTRKVELNGLNIGAILNESYITTYVFHGGLSYFPNEEWGFGIEGFFANNNDNSARYCIEHFYNDPLNEVGAQCDTDPSQEGASLQGVTKANYGPAYVPIREVKYAVAGTAIWNPVYGKQLFFLSGTGYFDLFVTMGAGLVFSDFYPQKTTLTNGKVSRGTFPADGTAGATPGAGPLETDSYGTAGRPVPEQSSDFMITTGFGQKYHFAKRYNFKVELRNYLLLGTDSGFDLFFTLWGGVGMRL